MHRIRPSVRALSKNSVSLGTRGKYKTEDMDGKDYLDTTVYLKGVGGTVTE